MFLPREESGRAPTKTRWDGRAVGSWAPHAVAAALALSAATGLAGAAVNLRATEGELVGLGGGRFATRSAKMRAIAEGSAGDAAELRFTYQGPTAQDIDLASGLARRQIGVKLRAADACNLVYVMWRLSPESRIAVSVKSNPGMRTSRECGNRGYRILKPQPRLADPAPGSEHVLRAEIQGGLLSVAVDGRQMGKWPLPGEAVAAAGPVGVRGDNARFTFSLRPGGGAAPPGRR